jgi:hypothetical protein
VQGSIIATGEKAKARDILAAIRTLKNVEQQSRPATADEQLVLSRFCGFGPVALGIFPDPVTGSYLQCLLHLAARHHRDAPGIGPVGRARRCNRS